MIRIRQHEPGRDDDPTEAAVRDQGKMSKRRHRYRQSGGNGHQEGE